MVGIWLESGAETTNLAVQGELTAPNVQNNPHQIDELRFHIFDVYDIDAQKYLTPFERCLLLSSIQSKHPDILHVPFVLVPELDDVEFSRKGLIEYFDGFKWSNCPAPQGEGVVFKHKAEKFTFKVINNSYLLKEAD